MVEAVTPGFLRDLLVALVGISKTAGQPLGNIDTDLAGLAGIHIVAVTVQQMDLIQGHRLTHRANLVAVTGKICNDDRALGLAEAFLNGNSCMLLELDVHLRIQRLTCGRGILHAGQVKPAQILLDQHPVHGRRCAEGGNIVFFEHGQDLLRIEAVKVIDKDRCLAQPLAIKLAPHGFGPAGVGNGQMQAIGIDPVPVFGGNEVTQRVLVIMGCQLGIAGSAGGEEHQHGIITAGRILFAGKVAGEHGVFFVKVVPAFPAAVHQDLMGQHGAVLSRCIHRIGHVTVGGTKDRLHVTGSKPVGKVLLQQLIGSGDHHRTQLVQTQHRKPVLVVALEHQHDPVATTNAQRLKIVGRSGGFFLHVPESEPPLGAVLSNVQHSQLFRLVASQLIDHIKGEVKLVFILEIDSCQLAVFHRGGDKVAIDTLDLIGNTDCRISCRCGSFCLTGTGRIVRQNDSVERTVLPIHSDHAVGGGRIVVNTVAGVQNFRMESDLDLHVTADHDVTFLTLVGHQLDILVLGAFLVFQLHVQRQGDTVAEVRCQVVADHVVGFFDPLSISLTGQGIGTQLGAAALQQVRKVHAEDQHTPVQKGNTHVAAAGLIRHVLFHGYICALGHFLHGDTADHPKLSDTVSNLADLIVHASHHLFH